jgi:histidyl-tRNA synthetase
MKSKLPQLLKGFRDYLPGEQIARRKIIAKISEVFERFGFAPMDTPALEYYELLGGKYGEEGENLMYKFKDQGGRMVALRYDLTVPLARVLSSYPDLPIPFKRYQIGNSWRAENPQKGRFREFTQCDVDIIGSESLIADAEVIAVMNSAYKALEIGDVKVLFSDRRIIEEVLSELGVPKSKYVKFLRAIDKLGKMGEEKVKTELSSTGFEEGILEGYKDLMMVRSKLFVEEMQNFLSGMGVENMEFDPCLARGLDYYTGTIFEFVLLEKPEFGSIGGGGRYDELIGNISGKKTPAVGGSIGLDRMFAALKDKQAIAPQTAAEVLVLNLDETLSYEYLNICTNLREAGIDCEFYFEASKLDKQFKYAQAKNIKLAVILGKNELEEKKVSIKDLVNRKQVTVDLDDLSTQVKSMLW